MNPATAEKVLTFLFRLNGVLLTSAFFTIFLPNGWMQSTHQWLGLGEMPTGSIVEYLARSCSMMYAVHGIVLLVISRNLRRHWELVPVFAVLHMGLGAVVLGIDLSAGMPWYWVAGEGPGIVVFGCVLFWLWRVASKGSGD